MKLGARIDFKNTVSLFHAAYTQQSDLLTVKVNWHQIRVKGLQGGGAGFRSLPGMWGLLIDDAFGTVLRLVISYRDLMF